MKHFLAILSITFLGGLAQGQDIDYARSVVAKLTAPDMHGRGYVNKGDYLAAQYLKAEFSKLGLQKFGDDYHQAFAHPVNTYPGKMEIHLDDNVLVPGKDFIVDPSSPGFFGTFELYWFEDLVLKSEKSIQKFIKKTDQFKFIVVKEQEIVKGEQRQLLNAAVKTYMARGIIIVRDKLTWGVSPIIGRYPIVEIQKDKISKSSRKINIEMECLHIPKYESQNIVGYIPGTQKDSFIVFTAHYDHLGRMGTDTYFPGANDNASGSAMILDLAKYYLNDVDTPKYSIAFIAFAAEEVGLAGSKYYTENPMFSLKKIKFLINLDLMGNGVDGITVVNGTVFKREFETLVALNAQDSLVKEVKIRGKAANSDHHFFTEKGVPSFFIYTLGGSKAYHDVFDTSDNLALSEYEDVFRLLTSFVSTIHQ